MDTIGWLCIGIAILFYMGHFLYSATVEAVHGLHGQIAGMAEEQPKLNYYIEKKHFLRMTAFTEKMAFSVIECGLVFYTAGYVCPKPLQWLAVPVTVVLCMLVDGAAKGYGRKHSEQVAIRFLFYLQGVGVLLLPLYGLHSLTNRLIGGKRQAKERVTEEEILQMLDESNETGEIEDQQLEMIGNIFEIDDRPVSEIMTHRKNVIAIDIDTNIQHVVRLARSENYSRMPVYQGSVDKILGVVNVKDLLGLIGCQNISGFNVQHFMRKALFIPETAKCDDVLQEMLRKKQQMAIVIDEYGGTAGIVCMEDILEEIVGNIQDEYDEEEVEIRRITENLYYIQGKTAPSDCMEILGIESEEAEEYDTMSGMVIGLLGRIPETGEHPSVEYHGVVFTVMRSADNWITNLKAEKIQVPTE